MLDGDGKEGGTLEWEGSLSGFLAVVVDANEGRRIGDCLRWGRQLWCWAG